jgi:hypothetical protein
MLPYWVRRWLWWSEWKYLYRRVTGFFVRGWRGWANHDAWGLDHYVSGVFAGSLRRLASTKRGCPHEFAMLYATDEEPNGDADKGTEAWCDWLRGKADWFEWYYLDEDGTSDDKGWIAPGMSGEEKKRRIDAHCEKMRVFHEEVLPDFVKNWGSLWD